MLSACNIKHDVSEMMSVEWCWG